MRIFQLARKIAAELEAKTFQDDTSFGEEHVIPAARVKFLTDTLAKFYLDLQQEHRTNLARLNQMMGGNVESISVIDRLITNMVAYLNDPSRKLKTIYFKTLQLISKINQIRLSQVRNDVKLPPSIVVKLDHDLKILSDKIWKATKAIVSSPQLKTPKTKSIYYTWNAGPGRNPTLPPMTWDEYRKMKEKYDRLSSDKIFEEIHPDAGSDIPSFEQFEKLDDVEQETGKRTVILNEAS